MKIIICLASHDPDAILNFGRLWNQRSGSIRDTTKCYLQISENGELVPVQPKQVNVFETVLLSEKSEVKIEFIAHGNPSIDKEFLSIQKGAFKPGQSNTFASITPIQLQKFFKTYALDDEQYKFNDLTLFCCTSFEFGKELSKLMPNVNVTCFKEAIIVHNDGFAYPYDNKGKPIDKKGNVIPFDNKGNLTSPHLSATPHIFCSGVELIDIDEKKSDVSASASTSTFSFQTLSASQTQAPQRGEIYPDSPTLLDISKQNASNKQSINSASPKAGRLPLDKVDDKEDEKKAALQNSVETPEPVVDALSTAKPMVVRGNPFARSQDVDSYLKAQRKNVPQNKIPDTPPDQSEPPPDDDVESSSPKPK